MPDLDLPAGGPAGGQEHARAGVAWKCVAEALEAFRASGGTDRPPWGHELSLPINPSGSGLAAGGVPLCEAFGRGEQGAAAAGDAEGCAVAEIHCFALRGLHIGCGAAPHGVRSPAFASSARCKRTR